MAWRVFSDQIVIAVTGTVPGTIALPDVEVTATQEDGFGGAGPQRDPYNTTCVLPDATIGTTDTPVMDTPLNVQSVTRQVLRDQQAITLGEALRIVSGVFVPSGAIAGRGTPGVHFRARF